MQVLDQVRPTDDELIASLDSAHARVCRAERELLRSVAQMEAREIWLEHGARDYAHWLSMHLGISGWKARRLIASGRALERLPLVSQALEEGQLGLVRYRDRECRFPGCGARRFTQAHHLTFWSHGGRTELANLLLICAFHHRLVHEYGWKVTRDRDGVVRWFDRGGAEYRAGPRP